MEAIDTLIDALRAADFETRAPIKATLLAQAKGANGPLVREHLDNLRRGELLEIQWEIEDVLSQSVPPPLEPPAQAPEPEPLDPAETPAEAADPNAPLSAADLDLVYDDPRGFMLHKSKVGQRWFATQVDPSTGNPQTFELNANELDQLKEQLQGSPYWRIGS